MEKEHPSEVWNPKNFLDDNSEPIWDLPEPLNADIRKLNYTRTSFVVASIREISPSDPELQARPVDAQECPNYSTNWSEMILKVRKEGRTRFFN